MITLQEILNLKTDLFKISRVKLVRHKTDRAEYRDLIKDRNELLKYQKEQSKPIFHNCDYIISFIGTERRKSILFGIFKVNGYEQINGSYYYNLIQAPEFDYLSDRIIIDWGNNAMAWHQWYDKQPKEIIQILPAGYLGEFPGLLNFVLDFNELKRLVEHPEANEDWKNHLSAINGVYLILDYKTGDQYVGSANGQDGIWQRWVEYSKTYHGGNQVLKTLCSMDKNYHKNFRYSVLQTLPGNITQKEIVKIENLYKEKLGTRVHGLNMN
jgi:hypothetical protein